MRIRKEIGMLLLAGWLILSGITPLLKLSFSGLTPIMQILAVAAGILILLDR